MCVHLYVLKQHHLNSLCNYVCVCNCYLLKVDEVAVSLQVNKVTTDWVTAYDSCQVTFGISALSGIYESNISGLTVLQLDTGLLSSCLPELTKMARKFTHISTLLQVSVFMGVLSMCYTVTLSLYSHCIFHSLSLSFSICASPSPVCVKHGKTFLCRWTSASLSLSRLETITCQPVTNKQI